MNPRRHFGRIPWMVDRPIARLVPTKDSTSIRPSTGFRTQDHSIRGVQDI